MRLITQLIIVFSLQFISSHSWGDLVKPALVEISVFHEGHYRVELRASIEALLSGINSQYKDTSQAPTAGEYDRLRKLDPEQLAASFKPFHSELLKEISIQFDGKAVTPDIARIEIPERGYTKIPRISIIYLEGALPSDAQNLNWRYPARFGDHAVRVRQVNQKEQTYHWSDWQWIRDDSTSEAFSLTEIANPRSTLDVVLDYIIAGFQHILPMGLDHILFILGLYLFSTHIKPLLWQVTMFTIAHTLTLGLAMNGLVQLPSAIVEPLIALSIVYVGLENIWHKKLVKSRLAIVFAFGLLHGLGFASVLSDFGMPSDAFITALISFNIGVEFGQLSIILAAWLTIGLWFGKRHWYRAYISIPASLTISAIALYWFWDRLEWPIAI